VSRDLLQWAVGLQQQWQMLFVEKAEVAAKCVQLASASPQYVCICSVPLGRCPACSGPCAEAFYKQAHCANPGRGGVWLMMCASVSVTEG